MKAKELLTVISDNGNDITGKIGKFCSFGISPCDGNDKEINIKINKHWGDEVFEEDYGLDDFVFVTEPGECDEFSWENEIDFHEKMKEYILNLWKNSTKEKKEIVFKKFTDEFAENPWVNGEYGECGIDSEALRILFEE